MLGFGKKKPNYACDHSDTDLSLDGSGKAGRSGQRLWRFFGSKEQSDIGTEITISGRRARIIESSDEGGYVEFL